MPRLSKNETTRRLALAELEKVKSQLHHNTYSAYQTNIYLKRIDVVKRIHSTLQTLGRFKTESFTSPKIKKLVKITQKAHVQKLQSHLKERYSYVRDVKKFNTTNEAEAKATFYNISPAKLAYILKHTDTSKRTLIKFGDGSYYTLKPDQQKKMLNNLNNFFVKDLTTSYTDAFTARYLTPGSVTLERPKWLGKSKLEGAFFKHYHNTKFDLDEFGIHEDKQEIYNENCFVQSLIALGVEETIVKEVRSIICSKYLPTNKLTQIAERFKLYIRVKAIGNFIQNHNDTKNFGKKEGSKEILIGLIDNHYFAIKPVKWTMYAVKHYFELKDEKDFQLIKDGEMKKDLQGKRWTNSWETIKYMYENKEAYLCPIPHEDILDTQYNNEAGDITTLDYSDEAIRPNKMSSPKDRDEQIVFFDFETITNLEIHVPFIVCNSETRVEYGKNCGRKMLYRLYEKFADTVKTLVLIAHNAGYDFRFIQQYLHVTNIIERGHMLLQVEGKFYASAGKYINIIIKDSYAVISMPLKKFGKSFDLRQEKEIMPYTLYTNENVEKQFVNLSEIRPYCDHQVKCDNLKRLVEEKEYDDYFYTFTANCVKWDCLKDGKVDIIKYSQRYCEMDVEVLKQGYNKFKDLLQEGTGMDVTEFMTSAQLAHTFMLKKDVFKDVLQVSSTPQQYIMKCMVGGRTMTAENKMWHINEILADFDAVSLYPSAMKRLGGYLKGRPKVLENRSYAFLKKQDGYFVQIKILKVGKKFKFPQMSYKNENGVRVWTNEPKQNLFVCKCQLEDLIEFHKIEFEVIDGYYYDEGRNMELGSVIEFVFKERLKLKKEGNALEQIYKLIMNSAYGKTMLKAFMDKTVFVAGKENKDKFIDKHYNRMIQIEELYGSTETFQRYKVKVEQGINEHFNNALCGVEVLAMSKRIMNEVMCLAEDTGCDIYYQDTDSIHIKQKDIAVLAEKFKEKYGRELIGKGMGQFHSDFSSDILKGDLHSVESIFLGKKCYIDKLEGDEKGVYDYHIRMKGVSNQSIWFKANTEVDDDGKLKWDSVMAIYKSLYEGKNEVFDLTCEGKKICFKFNKNYTISTELNFIRTLKFEEPLQEVERVEMESVKEQGSNIIYLLHSENSNQIYVGQTVSFEKRKKEHMLASIEGHPPRLYEHIAKTGGWDLWQMTVLERMECDEKLTEREQFWMDKLKPSLNMRNAIRKPKEKEFVILRSATKGLKRTANISV